MSGNIATEITAILGDQPTFMPESAVLQVWSGATADGFGGKTETWTSAGTYPIAISVSTSLAEQQNVAEVLTVKDGVWKARLPLTCPAKVHDRLVVGSHTYQVLFVDDAPTFATVLRVLLERVS